MAVLSEEQMKEILDGAIEKIRDAVIDEATKKATWHVQASVHTEVEKVVRDFIREEVAPEIITSLQERKSAIISAAIISAENMAVLLAEAMSASMAENLGSSYGRKKIFEALFD